MADGLRTGGGDAVRLSTEEVLRSAGMDQRLGVVRPGAPMGVPDSPVLPRSHLLRLTDKSYWKRNRRRALGFFSSPKRTSTKSAVSRQSSIPEKGSGMNNCI